MAHVVIPSQTSLSLHYSRAPKILQVTDPPRHGPRAYLAFLPDSSISLPEPETRGLAVQQRVLWACTAFQTPGLQSHLGKEEQQG